MDSLGFSEPTVLILFQLARSSADLMILALNYLLLPIFCLPNLPFLRAHLQDGMIHITP